MMPSIFRLSIFAFDVFHSIFLHFDIYFFDNFNVRDFAIRYFVPLIFCVFDVLRLRSLSIICIRYFALRNFVMEAYPI